MDTLTSKVLTPDCHGFLHPNLCLKPSTLVLLWGAYPPATLFIPRGNQTTLCLENEVAPAACSQGHTP